MNTASASKTRRPNIICILTDDLGFSDFGCYGGEIETPNIDRLAARGLRFRQFYNCARCCPTRASLLTGLYAHQANLANNGRSLSSEVPTIAEVLRENGYRTAMMGKWHLSSDERQDDETHLKWINHHIEQDRPFAPPESYPAQRGFERHFGIVWGVIDHFDPFSLVDGMEPVKEVDKDFYFTDAITDRSVDTIREWGGKEDPFFMYVAHTAPHWPLHAKPEDIAKYKGRYDKGWDQLRRARFARQVEMGIFDPERMTLPPLEPGENWDSLSKEDQAWQAAKMEVHAAMVDRIDQSVGRIVAALEETGSLDDTIIMIMSDNGASPEVPSWKAGYDRPSHTRDGRPMLREADLREKPHLLGTEESYTGIGPSWANAVNTPYRFWKKESYEGGVQTPLVVHWPSGLGAEPGGFADPLSHVMDLMPTFLDLADVAYPSEFKGRPLQPMGGRSLRRTLEGEVEVGHEKLYFEHVKGRAIRTLEWKAVALCDKPTDWKLYRVEEDPTEMRDVAGSYPDQHKALVEDWNQWYEQMPK